MAYTKAFKVLQAIISENELVITKNTLDKS